MQILKKGNKEKGAYKKRKEKKLSMQGKSNMVLDYFIINIHMQLRRREAGHNSSNFLKPRENSRKRRKEKQVAAALEFWFFGR